MRFIFSSNFAFVDLSSLCYEFSCLLCSTKHLDVHLQLLLLFFFLFAKLYKVVYCFATDRCFIKCGYFAKKQQLVFKIQCITKNRRTSENSLYVCFTVTKLATSVADSRSQSQIVWVRLTFKLRDVHSITRH